MERITSSIMMVRPANFGFNQETAENNAFQKRDEGLPPEDIHAKALLEFDHVVTKLRQAEIEVFVFQDSAEPVKPDAIFPNNWISLHADGRIITYPMWSQIRRQERREDIIHGLQKVFRMSERIHLEMREDEGKYLEGTGSIVFDRRMGVAYACLSPRTHPQLFLDYCKRFGYVPVLFEAVDVQQQLIYHTNVMMALGDETAVVCLDSIAGSSDRAKVLNSLDRGGFNLVEISYAQMEAFAGNMLQLRAATDIKYMVMSEQAYLSLNSDQIRAIEKEATCYYLSIYTIEKAGGGSIRCMMTEIFLPRYLV